VNLWREEYRWSGHISEMTEHTRWRMKNVDMVVHRFSKNKHLTSAGQG